MDALDWFLLVWHALTGLVAIFYDAPEIKRPAGGRAMTAAVSVMVVLWLVVR